MSQFKKLTADEVNIWKQAIALALGKLTQDGWNRRNNSTKFDVVYNGIKIPPKEIIKFVFDHFEENNIVTGIEKVRGGDDDTNTLLRDLGLTVIEKDKGIKIISNLEELKNALQERLSQPDSFLKIGAEYNQKIFLWITDKDKYFDTKHAHYEIYVKGGVINIDLHFEVKETKWELFNALGEIVLPLEELVWQRTKSSVRYAKKYSFNDENLVENVFYGLTDLYHLTYNKLKPLLTPLILQNKLEQANEQSLMKQSLNQILYGPPGTGKTYHTINKALAIIENKSEDELAKESREELKRRYQEYVANGQIVFTTFHQSMGYEDFVEGIKPEIEEDKDGVRTVVYETRAGIFKELCKNAAISTVKEEQPVVYQFDEAWEDLMEDVRIKTEDAKEDFVLDILTPNRGLKVTEITDQGNLRITPMSVEGLTYTVSYARAKKLQAAFPDLSVVKNIDKEFRAVIGGSNSTAYWAVINNLNKKIAANQSIVEISSSELKPHVLIIDEINRGNVSAIFGELITLIEESKRAGASEALELTLPYSKDKFSVPSNLYIIGTMNTADRSVEALDTALRRRFAFEEMMPEPMKIATEGALIDGIIEGVDLAKVLTKINERIEVLLDADHQIGHSYLINVSDLSGLANAFNNCIIPLLKEYFYHDDEKIALVLGSGFVSVKKQLENVHALFPQMESLDIHNIHGKSKFDLKQIHSANIIEALTTLLAGA